MTDTPRSPILPLVAIPGLALLIWLGWTRFWAPNILDAGGNPDAPGLVLSALMALLLAQGLWLVLAGLARAVAGDWQRLRPTAGRFFAAGLLGLIAPIANLEGFPILPLFPVLFGGPADLLVVALGAPFAAAFLLISLTGAQGGWGLTLTTARLWAATYGGMILLQGVTPLVWR